MEQTIEVDIKSHVDLENITVDDNNDATIRQDLVATRVDHTRSRLVAFLLKKAGLPKKTELNPFPSMKQT